MYWPLIFILTHIPVPKFVGGVGMSDKTMHYLAYLILVSLLWPAVSPYHRVDWRKAKVWIVLAIIVWYGATDEWLQGFVNRSPDVGDFKADFAGAMTGLTILTIFRFWPGLLSVLGILIFAATNLTKYRMFAGNEILNTSFYFIGYSLLTLVWMQCMGHNLPGRKLNLMRIITAVAAPLLYLGVVVFCLVVKGKHVWIYDIASAAAGIIISAVVSWVICKNNKTKACRESLVNKEDRQ